MRSSTATARLLAAGLFVVCAMGLLAGSLGVGGNAAAAIQAVAVLLPAGIAAVTAWRVAANSESGPGRVWVGYALGLTASTIAVFISRSPILDGSDPRWSYVSTGLLLADGLAIAVTSVASAGFRVSSAMVTFRHLVDLGALGLIVYVAAYALFWRPLAERRAPDVAEWVVVVGPMFAVVGLVILAGVLINYAGRKFRIRAERDSALAIGLALIGIGTASWQLWYSGSVVNPGSWSEVPVQVLWVGGYAAIVAAGSARLRSPHVLEAERRGLPRMRPDAHVVPAAVVPIVYIALMVLAFWRASTVPGGSVDTAVYRGVGLGFAMLVGVRSVLTALENSYLFNRAVTDQVTGLLGHRFFHERLRVEVDLAGRHGEEVAVVVADLDDFSRVNSISGHGGGDEMLRLVAREIAACCGDTATVCRLGGDEFGVILPETGARGAAEACEVIQKRLFGITTADARPLTASIGISVFPTDGLCADDLYRCADGAQYWAKYHGKDAVVVYDASVVDTLDAEERIRKMEDQSRLAAVRALAAAVDARDPSAQYHSRNVAALAVRLGEILGLDPQRIRLIEFAALLHDVGLIAVPDAILTKRGSLTEDERVEIRQHPALGEKVLASNGFDEILPWVRAHHEHWDGSGYPDGLAGEEIPLEARILRLCDTYDAMTSTRSYRGGVSEQAALQEIDLGIGLVYDPVLADEFIRMVCSMHRGRIRAPWDLPIASR